MLPCMQNVEIFNQRTTITCTWSVVSSCTRFVRKRSDQVTSHPFDLDEMFIDDLTRLKNEQNHVHSEKYIGYVFVEIISRKQQSAVSESSGICYRLSANTAYRSSDRRSHTCFSIDTLKSNFRIPKNHKPV